MKKLFLLSILSIIAFNLVNAQSNNCPVVSPLLEAAGREENPCPQCSDCTIPENVPLSTMKADYSTKNNNDKVIGFITKGDLIADRDPNQTDPDSPSDENLEAVVNHVGSYMDIEAMLECINLNCFVSSMTFGGQAFNVLDSINIDDLNKYLLESGYEGDPVSQMHIDSLQNFFEYHNIDSIAAWVFCNEGLPGGGRDTSSVDCEDLITYQGPCDSIIVGENGPLPLTERSGPGDMTDGELDLFSSQMQGLGIADKMQAPPTADIKKIMTAINAGVNLFNGLPDIGLNLMNFDARDIGIPIGINNTGTGVKVNEYSSDLGMSWSLDAGGVITRSMKGLPDEFDGYSYGEGIGPAPTLKPCGRISGLGIQAVIPPKKISWSFTEANVIHIRPVIATFFVYAIEFFITLDITIEVNVRYKPDMIQYRERGLGYIKANDPVKMDGVFDINQSFSTNDFLDTEPGETSQDKALRKIPLLNAINGNKALNDFQFLSPRLGQAWAFLKGIENVFGNITETTKRLDYEQDEFYYSFPGHSGKFIILQNNKVLMMPSDNLIITPVIENTGGADHIVSFTVETSEGLTYTFGNQTTLDGVDFAENTNYVLPNYFTYKEESLYPSLFGDARLIENSQPFQGAVMCWPSALEYGASYESGFTIKKSPRYTSSWHLVKVTSKVSAEEVLLEYEKSDPQSYFTSKDLQHEFPDFDRSGNYFLAKQALDFANVPKLLTEYQYARNSFIYTATETKEEVHRLKRITGDLDETVTFFYEEDAKDIVNKKLLSRIEHNYGNKNERKWIFNYLLPATVNTDFDCSTIETRPAIEAPGEFSFDLSTKLEKHDYPFLEFYYLHTYTTFFVPVPSPIVRKRVNHQSRITEFGSLMHVKSLADPSIDLDAEVAKFNGEKMRKFLKSVTEAGGTHRTGPAESKTIFNIDYLGESDLASMPKRFSMQQDLGGYYNTNPSGSLLPVMAYPSADNIKILPSLGGGHYGFQNSDPHYDVKLGHTEEGEYNKCSIGYIKSVTNETGGKYEYKYELNLIPNSFGNLIKSGGLRVASLTEKGSNSNIKITNYKYEDPFWNAFPVRSYKAVTTLIDYAYQRSLFSHIRNLNKIVRTSSQPMNEIPAVGKGTVGYKKVYEVFPGNGKILHEYSDGDNSLTATSFHIWEDKKVLNLTNPSGDQAAISYPLFNKKICANPDMVGKELNVSVYDEDNNLKEQTNYTYDFLADECHLILSTGDGKSECDLVRLTLSHGAQMYPGIFNDNWIRSEIFNFISPWPGVIGQIISYIKVVIGLANPFRVVVKNDVFYSESLLPYNKKAVVRVEQADRYYTNSNQPETTTKKTSYYNENLPSGMWLQYHRPVILTRSVTEYINNISNTTVSTVTEHHRYPQNTSASDLKTGTTAYDYMRNNHIYIPVVNTTLLGSSMIDGDINVFSLEGGRLVTQETWGAKAGAWVLDGKYQDWDTDGFPTKYYRAFYGTGTTSAAYTFYTDPIEMTWDTGRRMLSSRKYKTFTENYVNTDFRELQSKTDPNGIISGYVYDSRGRLKTSEVKATGIGTAKQTTLYEYFLGASPNTIRNTTTYSDATPSVILAEAFDGMGNVLLKTKNGRPTQRFTYDQMFRPVTEFNMGSGTNTLKYERNSLNELIEVKDAVGNITATQYTGPHAGTAKSFTGVITTDPNGHVSESYDNPLGSVVKTISGEGAVTIYDYDDYNRLTRITNPIGEQYAFEYNAMDKMMASLVPGSGLQLKWYDEKYRLAAVKEPNGKTFINKYDDYNRLTGTAMLSSSSYSGDGIVSSASIASDYTGGTEVLKHTYQSGKTWLQDKEEYIFDYANSGAKKITGLTMDAYGRVTNEVSQYPKGTITRANTYNNADLQTQQANSYAITGGGSYSDVSDFEFDQEHRLWRQYFDTDMSAQRLISQIKYDDQDRMITKWLDEDELQEVNYKYDAAGKLTHINDMLTTDCNEDMEICAYTMVYTRNINLQENNLVSVIFNNSLFYNVNVPMSTFLVPNDLKVLMENALAHFGLEGIVSVVWLDGYFTLKITGCNATSIQFRDDNYNFYNMTQSDCCRLAPNDDGDGPQGPGPTPPGGAYDAADLFAEEIEYRGLDIRRITYYNDCNSSAFTNIYSYNRDHMLLTVENKIVKPAQAVIGGYNEAVTYDLAGNILTHQRKAITNFTYNTISQIDDLVYTYASGSSRLNSVADNSTSNQTKGLRPVNSKYNYNAAGSIIKDSGKGISIEYNAIELPVQFKLPSSAYANVDYTYGGEKVRTDYTGVGPETVHYLGAIELHNNERTVHHHAEGRMTVDPNRDTYVIEYTLRDHLGNTVVTFADIDGDGEIDPLAMEPEVIQRNMYYAFGMEIEGNWNRVSYPYPDNNYLYNGKELHEWSGLNWSDYGARWYMPEIGRFTGVDPVAAATPQWTTYAYCGDDPVSFVDPTGGFRTKISAWTYAKLNGGTAYFNSELGEYAVDKYRTSFTGEGSAAMFEYTLISRNTSYSSGKKSLVGHWVKSAFDGINKMFGKIPSGSSNNFEEKGQSHVGDGIEMLSNTSLPGNGTVGTNTGSSSAVIETGDMVIPSEGGVLGTATAGAQIPNAIYNAGQSINSGTEALNKSRTPLSSAREDTTVKSKSGRWNIIYDKKELKARGRYKEK